MSENPIGKLLLGTSARGSNTGTIASDQAAELVSNQLRKSSHTPRQPSLVGSSASFGWQATRVCFHQERRLSAEARSAKVDLNPTFAHLANEVSYGWQATRRLSTGAHSAKVDVSVNQFRNSSHTHRQLHRTADWR